MKKYIAPVIKVLEFDACDIIQTSAETTVVSVPKTVVNGTNVTDTAQTKSYQDVSSILE